MPFASSDHSPVLAEPPLLVDRARTVYSVPFVRVGIVWPVFVPGVTLARRLVESQSSLPDLHSTS